MQQALVEPDEGPHHARDRPPPGHRAQRRPHRGARRRRGEGDGHPRGAAAAAARASTAACTSCSSRPRTRGPRGGMIRLHDRLRHGGRAVRGAAGRGDRAQPEPPVPRPQRPPLAAPAGPGGGRQARRCRSGSAAAASRWRCRRRFTRDGEGVVVAPRPIVAAWCAPCARSSASTGWPARWRSPTWRASRARSRWWGVRRAWTTTGAARCSRVVTRALDGLAGHARRRRGAPAARPPGRAGRHRRRGGADRGAGRRAGKAARRDAAGREGAHGLPGAGARRLAPVPGGRAAGGPPRRGGGGPAPAQPRRPGAAGSRSAGDRRASAWTSWPRRWRGRPTRSAARPSPRRWCRRWWRSRARSSGSASRCRTLSDRLPSLIVVSGPSGAGKSTILARVLEEMAEPALLRLPHHARAARRARRTGVQYHFVDRAEFEGMRGQELLPGVGGSARPALRHRRARSTIARPRSRAWTCCSTSTSRARPRCGRSSRTP